MTKLLANTRNITILTIVAICLLLSTLPLTAVAAEVDRIIAIVDDDIITQTELDNELTAIRQQEKLSQLHLPADNILKKQVLERLILKRIQQQLAANNGITVDDETLNKTLRNIARQNNMSLTEFHDALERDGLDFEFFRENIRNEITFRKLRQRFVDRQITVSEQEIDNFLANQKTQGHSSDEYRVGHILIAIPEAASAEQIHEAEQTARDLLQRLESGDDFSQTAISHSDGQQALQGGDLGWRKISELPTLFASRIQQMEVGQLSRLIRSASGFHIIKLLDHRSGKRHFVTQTKVRHILIKPDALTSEQEAYQKILQIRARLESGEEFSALARELSDDKASATQGGDLGWTTTGQMVTDFETAMNKLSPGEISKPVKTRFGWHLIQVNERRTKDDTEEFNRAKARQLLYQQKIEEAHMAWLRRIRSEAYVEDLSDTQD